MEPLEYIPLDPIFSQIESFLADPNPNKLNLGIGIYADESGKPYVLPSIQAASRSIPVENYNYFTMRGDPIFLEHVKQWALGKTDFPVAMQQTAGGTHACKVFSDLMKRWGLRNILIGNPTWPNHRVIFRGKTWHEIEHFDRHSHEVNLEAYLTGIKSLPEPAVIVLHAGSAHNPSGRNLSLEQLKELCSALQTTEHFLFLDAAYLGLGDGIAADLDFVRYAFNNVKKCAVAVSFSKNASLYRHRCGALLIKSENSADLEKPSSPLVLTGFEGRNVPSTHPFREKSIIESHTQQLIRKEISNPPAFGSMVMNQIFSDEKSLSEWQTDLEQMRVSIAKRKNMLADALGPRYEYLKKNAGMFGLLDISIAQIEQLEKKHSIYVTFDGRINFSGIRLDQIDYLVDSLKTVLKI